MTSASATATWTTRAPLPQPGAEVLGAVSGGRAYAFIGYHAHLGENPSTHRYDTLTDSWQSLAPMTVYRHGFGGAEVAGKVYVIGGWDGRSLRPETEFYEAATNVWTRGASIPLPRSGVAAAPLNGKVYAIGGGIPAGYDGTGEYPSGCACPTVEAYDPVTDTWTRVAPLNVGRGGAAAAVVHGVLYAAGGADIAGTRLTVVEAYDPATNTWGFKAPLPAARMAASAVAIDGKLYVVGGSDASGQPVSDVYAYDPATNSWTSAPSMPTARQRAGVAALPGGLHVFGGYGNGSQTVHEVLLSPQPPPQPANPTTKEQCFREGWRPFGFRNQGQCVRFVETGKDSRA